MGIPDPVVFGPVGTVGTPAHIDGTVRSMSVFTSWSVVGFELLTIRLLLYDKEIHVGTYLLHKRN